MAKIQRGIDRAIDAQERTFDLQTSYGTAIEEGAQAMFCAPPKPPGAPPMLGSVARSSAPSGGLSRGAGRGAVRYCKSVIDNVVSAASMDTNSYSFESVEREWKSKKTEYKSESISWESHREHPVGPVGKRKCDFCCNAQGLGPGH